MSNNLPSQGIITDIKLLRKKNEKVLKEEGDYLIRTLEINLVNGIGLAAPQIGINKQVAIIRMGETKLDFINPEIIQLWSPYINKDEACLSFPNRVFNTFRFKQIHIKDDLHPAGLVLTDFISVVVQHELDHLFGILIIDRATDQDKLGRNDLCPCLSGIKYKKCHGR